MKRFLVGDAEVEYVVRGSSDGEPVLLIHGGLIADSFEAFVSEPAVAQYQLITYHRRGYAGSTGGGPQNTLATHAADAAALLSHLGIERAHVVGHSYGGSTALELAATHPDVVRSLVLLEPGLPIPALPGAEALTSALGGLLDAFNAGDFDRAVEIFVVAMLAGEGRSWVKASLGSEVWAQMTRDADDAFGVELPSLFTWNFGAEQAARIHHPVSFVRGTETDAPIRAFIAANGLDPGEFSLIGASVAVLRTWLPQLEVVDVAGVTHAMQMQAPRAVAEVVADLLAQHVASAR